MNSIIVKNLCRNYMTFNQERFPHVGIYYLFKCHDRGVCAEGLLDVQKLVEEKEKSVVFSRRYTFAGEQKFLSDLESRRIQGIKTRPVQGLSLRKLMEVIANQHFEEFLKRHPWLTDLEIKKYLVRYSNFFDFIRQAECEN